MSLTRSSAVKDRASSSARPYQGAFVSFGVFGFVQNGFFPGCSLGSSDFRGGFQRAQQLDVASAAVRALPRQNGQYHDTFRRSSRAALQRWPGRHRCNRGRDYRPQEQSTRKEILTRQRERGCIDVVAVSNCLASHESSAFTNCERDDGLAKTWRASRRDYHLNEQTSTSPVLPLCYGGTFHALRLVS
jgi:hypothetical protein